MAELTFCKTPAGTVPTHTGVIGVFSRSSPSMRTRRPSACNARADVKRVGYRLRGDRSGLRFAAAKSSVSQRRPSDDGSPGSSVRLDEMWRRRRPVRLAPASVWTATRRVVCAPSPPPRRLGRRRRSKARRCGPTRTTRGCRGSTQTSLRRRRRIGRPDGQAAPVRPAGSGIAQTRKPRAGGRDRSRPVGRRHRCGIASARGTRQPWETSCLGAAAGPMWAFSRASQATTF